MAAHLANALSAARLASAPLLFAWCRGGEHEAALALLGAGGMTDIADGVAARRAPGGGSQLGSYLDPAADKAFAGAATLGLAMDGALPGWFASVVLGRDAALVTAVGLGGGKHKWQRVEPSDLSKANTALQATLHLGTKLSLSLSVRPPPPLVTLPPLSAPSRLQPSGLPYPPARTASLVRRLPSPASTVLAQRPSHRSLSTCCASRPCRDEAPGKPYSLMEPL